MAEIMRAKVEVTDEKDWAAALREELGADAVKVDDDRTYDGWFATITVSRAAVGARYRDLVFQRRGTGVLGGDGDLRDLELPCVREYLARARRLYIRRRLEREAAKRGMTLRLEPGIHGQTLLHLERRGGAR